MNQYSKKYKMYFALIILLAVFALISVYFPQGEQIPMEDLEINQSILALVNFGIMLLIYGPLGYIGLKLSDKMDLTYNEPSNYRLWLKKTTVIGMLLGVSFIIFDLIFASIHGLGMLPHPPFFTAIIASVTAAIGEEVIFRLFFITFWYWVIGYKLFKSKYNNYIYWIISGLSAIAFTVAHMPSIMYLYGFESVSSIPVPLIVELLIMNGSLSLFAAYYYRKYGIFAAMNIHFVLDIVWHVLWGLA
jgi:membrane protease YdiL (CAAX protease family)